MQQNQRTRNDYVPPSLVSLGTLSAVTAAGSMGPYCDAVVMTQLGTDPQYNPFCM